MKDHLKYVGENIRVARKNKGLTMDILSELVGISPSFLGTIERGESFLSVETLINLCRVLGVSADSILFQQSAAQAPTDAKDVLTTLLHKATEDELLFLIDYIKFYRGKIVFQDS